MKKYLLPIILTASILYGCDVLQEIAQEALNTEIDTNKILGDNALLTFHQKSPISTTFSDAIYEAEVLENFEPRKDEYLPIDIQPKANTGGYILKSGIYTMDAKSFCLRGYTNSFK